MSAYVGSSKNLKDLNSDTMSLLKADLGLVCVTRVACLGLLKHPNRATLYNLYTSLCTGELNSIRKHKCFLCSPFYGRACRWAMLGELKPEGPRSGIRSQQSLKPVKSFPLRKT